MLVAAVVILLSMLGLNLSGLLIPAGVALALAAKDLSHNFLAGFFLFAVQVPLIIVVPLFAVQVPCSVLLRIWTLVALSAGACPGG